MKAIEGGIVLHVERKPMGACWNMGNVGPEVGHGDEPVVPYPVVEFLWAGEMIALEVLPKLFAIVAGLVRKLDIRVELGFDEPERPDVKL